MGLCIDFNMSAYTVNPQEHEHHSIFPKPVRPWSTFMKNTLRNVGDGEKTNMGKIKNPM